MVYFLSDTHLGASYLPDRKEMERRLAALFERMSADATDLYLLGDILDYWYEYRTVVPRGYVRFFGALAKLVDRGVKVHWFIGNHDIWLFDYLRDEIGIEIIDGYQVKEILGKRFFLSHGDGVGHLDRGFRFIRAIFRNKLCQKLYASVHPRWTVPFAHWWSNENRAGKRYASPPYGSEGDEPLEIFVREYLRDVDPSINYFVFGHRHVVLDQQLTPTSQMIILGDWISNSTYGKFDGQRFELLEFEARNCD